MVAFALALSFLLNYKLKLCEGTANICSVLLCITSGWCACTLPLTCMDVFISCGLSLGLLKPQLGLNYILFKFELTVLGERLAVGGERELIREVAARCLAECMKGYESSPHDEGNEKTNWR